MDKVPENMTVEEAAEFWEEHSFLDYDDIKEVHFSVDLRETNMTIEKPVKARRVTEENGIEVQKGCKGKGWHI